MSTVSNSRLIHITDNKGKRLLPEADLAEPEGASILLTEGIHGTAWQKWYSDGLWHSVRGGGGKTWEWLLRRPRVVLVYDAEPREGVKE